MFQKCPIESYVVRNAIDDDLVVRSLIKLYSASEDEFSLDACRIALINLLDQRTRKTTLFSTPEQDADLSSCAGLSVERRRRKCAARRTAPVYDDCQWSA